ncbi:Methyltransferase domain-containing protein [Halodesulfovibrio marinisediminis DSM 17456]|uniref:Arsenite methyltransferase n=2 Tax=Halodesulfovibrio marinisediminis TaxID=458711 RepID=A0A1N6FQV3_9BACT|nr:methyltransferase domain-containing protein [Halodesulfovibrio marinisediminis]SIN97618.1 Methyltransferase domain-containing protein [Halodesulfovibrio marinisediminis DSM 17456]
MLKPSAEDTQKITSVVKRKYKNVAESLEHQFQYPTGREGLRGLQYPEELFEWLPDDVAKWYCGVGNPFSLSDIRPGEHVLDLGCGAGVDTILAAKLAGPSGTAVGVDFSDEMIQRAQSNKALVELENVSFQIVDSAELPFDDEQFDVVTTNAMLNLAVDKAGVLKEVYRVLKEGGRLHVADQIFVGATMSGEQAVDSWFK